MTRVGVGAVLVSAALVGLVVAVLGRRRGYRVGYYRGLKDALHDTRVARLSLVPGTGAVENIADSACKLRRFPC